MKKNISILLVLLIIAGAAGAYYYFFWKRSGPLGDLQAAGYVPQETDALIEITDWQRTKTRWKETALYKISQEPEVAAFLEKPESLVPINIGMDALNRFLKLDPKEVFIAAAGQGATGPKVVAGFDFKGSKKDADALVADLKGDLKARFPDGKSDLQQYGSSQIETFAEKETFTATVFKGRWFFVSNDIDLLKATLDRVDGKIDAKTSLRENATYQAALAKLPKDSDAVLFVQMKGLIDPLAMVLSTAPNVNDTQLNELRKIQSISASMKLDGENIRDALYVSRPGGSAQTPLALNSLSFTAPETVLYTAVAPHLKSMPSLPSPAIDPTGIFTQIGNLRQMLAGAGLHFNDFNEAFGPEWGSVTNWEPDSLKPDWLLTLDVRDKAKAQKFIETLTAGQAGAATWAKQEIDGTVFYSVPQSDEGMVRISPALALTDKTLLFSIDIDSVKKAVQGVKSDSAGIDKTADFQKAGGFVGKPTGSFAYINTRVLFEKAYGIASNALKMMAVFNPHASDYADLGKLPAAETISKHLGPIVYSQSSDENGVTVESVGPVTFTELLLITGGAGAAYMWRSQAEAHEPPVEAFPAMPANPAPDQSGTSPAPSPQTAPGTP